ncbi:MAG: hypothetical protein ABGZ17_29880 [Planctomycetaceae bacterium]
MTDQIDEFESMFKRAEREMFSYVDIPIETVAIVTDGTEDACQRVRSDLIAFQSRLESVTNWRMITGSDYSNVSELLELINQDRTDLIVTYRHLHERAPIPQHSLGVYLDVLTQMTTIPVLVLPGTSLEPRSLAGRVCNRVMVVTDHISGDSRLINYGARMCTAGGTVWLCHVEDDLTFRRYTEAIGRIPEIDTDLAEILIDRQLTKDASDFINTCIEELNANGPHALYQAEIQRGHHLRVYRSMIDAHDTDLLVTNTKDEGQLAMHGTTYSLSIELLDVSMLLL